MFADAPPIPKLICLFLTTIWGFGSSSKKHCECQAMRTNAGIRDKDSSSQVEGNVPIFNAPGDNDSLSQSQVAGNVPILNAWLCFSPIRAIVEFLGAKLRAGLVWLEGANLPKGTREFQNKEQSARKRLDNFEGDWRFEHKQQPLERD